MLSAYAVMPDNNIECAKRRGNKKFSTREDRKLCNHAKVETLSAQRRFLCHQREASKWWKVVENENI